MTERRINLAEIEARILTALSAEETRERRGQAGAELVRTDLPALVAKMREAIPVLRHFANRRTFDARAELQMAELASRLCAGLEDTP